MAESVRIGLRTKFRGDLDDYERWKEEWRLVTEIIRLKAAQHGINLSNIAIVEGTENE